MQAPCPSGRRVPFPSGRFRRAANRGVGAIAVRNRRKGGRETPCRPAVPRRHRREPEVFGQSDANIDQTRSGRVELRIEIFETALPLAGLERCNRVLAQIPGSERPVDRERPSGTRRLARRLRALGGLLLVGSKAMTFPSFRLPIIAARRPQVNRAIFASNYVENRLMIAYSHTSHYSHRSAP